MTRLPNINKLKMSITSIVALIVLTEALKIKSKRNRLKISLQIQLVTVEIIHKIIIKIIITESRKRREILEKM